MENGKTVKRTVTAYARDRRDKLAMKAHGTTASKTVEFMFGQTGIVLRANGSTAVDTESGLSIGENGLIKANGRKGLKRATEYRNLKAELVTKVAGLLVSKKVMELRSMPMEVSFSLNRQTLKTGEEEIAAIFRSR